MTVRERMETENRLTGPRFDGARWAAVGGPMLTIDMQPGGHKTDHKRTYLRPAVGFTTAALRIHSEADIRRIVVAAARTMSQTAGDLRGAAEWLQSVALDLAESGGRR